MSGTRGPRSPHKVVPPVSITAEFVGGATLDDLKDNAAVLSIRTDDSEWLYWCQILFDGARCVGFRLTRFGEVDGYDVSPTLKSCTCPDHQFRARQCKHLRALAQALPTVRR